ncbi:hypothetical protein [Serratia marcescens]|uniref:hypothetical protein n=1 Tax=Serratia marcescens TaxID=615 RepID=UPI0007C90ACE|nr:hypothetical protein [Serratia marcescens]OAH32773.1 hypothetical protein AYJ10_18725 [Serratia marcescens]
MLTYNRTRDERLLAHYRPWANAYLRRHVDASLVAILYHQHQTGLAERYRRETTFFFPADARFAPPASTQPEAS